MVAILVLRPLVFIYFHGLAPIKSSIVLEKSTAQAFPIKMHDLSKNGKRIIIWTNLVVLKGQI